MCISFAGRAMSLVSVKNIWFPLQFNHTLQIQIRLVRQWSDPTLEQTNMRNFWGQFFSCFCRQKIRCENYVAWLLWYDFKNHLVQMFHAFRGRHALIRFQVSWLVSLTTFFFCVGGVQDNAQRYLGYWIFGKRKQTWKREPIIEMRSCVINVYL